MSKKFVALALLGLLSTQVFMPIVFADQTVKPDIYGSFKKVKHIYLTGNGLFTNHKQFGSDSFLISSKEIDDLSVHFNKVTKRLAVSMHDTLKRDEDGWVIEPRNGSILLNKNSLKELFGSTDDIAVKDHFFRTVTVNGSKFLRVDVDDTRDCSIVVQRFVEPEFKQRWFTKGCNASIRLADRAMFIEVCGRDKRGFNLSFDHPVDHSGQKVFVNKSWLESKGILHPVFEWGDKTPWKPLSYRDEGDFYVLEPEHFSIIGIHDSETKIVEGCIYGFTDTNASDTTIAATQSVGTQYTVNNIHTATQLFKEYYAILKVIKISGDNMCSGGNLTISNELNEILTYKDGGTYSNYWNTFDIPDINIDSTHTYLLNLSRYDDWMTIYIRDADEGRAYADTTLYCGGDLYNNNYRRDMIFKLIGVQKTFDVNRTIGSSSEKNEINFTTIYSYNSTDELIYLKIPVSEKVTGIINVTNISTNENLVEVYSLSNASINSFYFDAINKFVYIFTGNISYNEHFHFIINCTYGGTFALTIPTFLRSGDYFMSRGLIKDADGNPINGMIATTTILAQNRTVLISTEWNCTGGNYQATIATNSLSPAVYSVEIRFTDLSSGVTFKTGDTLYLDVPISGGGGGGSEIYSSAWLYYNFIDANSGSKLEDDFYKFYISPTTSFSEASRVVGGKYPVTLGKTYYYKVLDYWNNKVYPIDADYASFFVDEAENYLDIFIPLNQFKIKNTNDSVAYIKLTNGPINGTDNTWYARWIPPYESTEIFLRSGVYNMTVQLYDVDDLNRLTNMAEVPVKILYVENLTVNTDTFYWIPGYKIGDIIISVWNTNSSIMKQMINIGVYVNNMNSSIINQIVNSTYLIENINTSIRYQTARINILINNTESNITNQLIVMQQTIDNSFANITNQTNYVWQEINNTNASILNQTNTVIQHINNTNATIMAQINTMIQDIYNYIVLESSRNILPGTISLWSFDNETIADDKGNPALAVNNVSVEPNGKFGGAGNFSGNDSFVHISNDLSLVNGSVEAWFKGNFSTNKNRGIVCKNNSYVLFYNSSDNTIEGRIGVDTSDLREHAEGSTQGVYAWWYPDCMGQTFTVGAASDNSSFIISQVSVNVSKASGLQGVVYCNLTAVNESGYPTGPVLSTGSMDLSDWNDYMDYSSPRWETFNMTPCVLQAGTKYAICIYAPNSTNSKPVYWRHTNNVYSGGNVIHNWSNSWGSDPQNDLFFKIYAVPSASVKTSWTPDNDWHHVVMTWDSNELKLYFDGNLVNETNSVPVLSSMNSSVYVGRTSNISESWKGLIDEMVFYNRVLNYADVEYRYTGYTPFYQWNIMLQSIDNTNSSIHAQINTVNQNIINTNSSIHNQLTVVSEKIDNTNSTIHTQVSLVSQLVNNTNSTIHTQLNSIVQQIDNMNNSINYQFNGVTQHINNFEDNITGQVNSVWFSVNNTNTSIHNQLNVLSADIVNMNSSIHTQINALSLKVTNVESNITNQTNLIGIQIVNTETNLTNQVNGVNITIMNHNSTVMNQLNAIMTKIINTNASIIDQVNLIWNEINNTNSSIQVQINGVHTTITTMWSNVNYSFSVIQSDISYHNTTIKNLIKDMNATLLAKLTNVLDNVSEAGESVFDKTMDILEVLGSKVNNMTIGDVVWTVLENITSMQQHMAENFSYIGQVNVNLTNETLEMLDQIYNALLDVNATAMKDLYDILQDVLEQFRLPHEWRLPSVNYTLNDTTPPTTTVSAVVTIENNIRVSWSSVDNVPLNVAHVTLYYKVENASYWKLWRSNQASTGNLIWDEEEPVEGKTYYFMALGSDANGNNETQSDSNTCSLVYRQFVLPVSGTPSFLGKVGLTGNSLLVVIVLILFVILGVLLYVGYRLKREVK